MWVGPADCVEGVGPCSGSWGAGGWGEVQMTVVRASRLWVVPADCGWGPSDCERSQLAVSEVHLTVGGASWL